MATIQELTNTEHLVAAGGKKVVLYDASGNPLLVAANPGVVKIDQTTDGTTNKVRAAQPTHDNLNANANLQVGDADVDSNNPVPTQLTGSILAKDTVLGTPVELSALEDGSGKYVLRIIDASPYGYDSTTERIKIKEDWTPFILEDTAVGNDKIFTVPASTEYEILSVYAAMTALAGGGSRTVSVVIATATVSEVLSRYTVGLVTTAGNTIRYTFAPSLAKETALDLGGGNVTVPMSPVFLPAGYKIRVHDVSAINALDTLSVRILVRKRTV